MRILRRRRGFQADHSSSSYLFYAADKPVSTKGQQLAHRYSSRADVDERTARYLKWGGSDLNYEAFPKLLGEHYDVMVSESYDWWTLMMAVPKTAVMQGLLAPFRDARGYNDLGVEVNDYGRRLAVAVHCMFDYGGPIFDYHEDNLETLAEVLTKIRGEILRGDVSFLRAVATFYDAEMEEEDEATGRQLAVKPPSGGPPNDRRTKAQLQAECQARGIAFLKSWTKEQLRAALAAASPSPISAKPPTRSDRESPRLSRSAQRLIDSLDRP